MTNLRSLRGKVVQLLRDQLQEHGYIKHLFLPAWEEAMQKLPVEVQNLVPAPLRPYMNWPRVLKHWQYTHHSGWTYNLAGQCQCVARSMEEHLKAYADAYLLGDMAAARRHHIKVRVKVTGEDVGLVHLLGDDTPMAVIQKLRNLEDKWLQAIYTPEQIQQHGLQAFRNIFSSPCRSGAIRTLRELVGKRGDLWLTILDEIIDEVVATSRRWKLAQAGWRNGHGYVNPAKYGLLVARVLSVLTVRRNERVGHQWKRDTRVAVKVAMAYLFKKVPEMPSLRQLSKVPKNRFWATLFDARNWQKKDLGDYFNHYFRLVVIPTSLKDFQPLVTVPSGIVWRIKWLRKFGRIPKGCAIRTLTHEEFDAMPTENFIWFQRLVKSSDLQNHTDDIGWAHTFKAAWRLAAVFGQKALQLWPTGLKLVVVISPHYTQEFWASTHAETEEEMPKIQAAVREHLPAGVDMPTLKWEVGPLIHPTAVHDMGSDLPLAAAGNKELAQFLAKHCRLGSDTVGALYKEYMTYTELRSKRALAFKIVKRWETLEGMGASLKMSLRELQNILLRAKYGKVSPGCEAFALAAAECGVSEEKYPKYEKKWVERMKTAESIPPSQSTLCVDGYRMHRMDADDPRGVFLGHYTDCCQHPGGAASSSAWHGHSNPEGCFVYIEKGNEIVAQSWCWRDGHIVCFDNVEAKGGFRNSPTLRRLYEAYAEGLIGKMGIEVVTVGTQYGKMNLTGLPFYSRGRSPQGVYSDARVQVLLAEKPLSESRVKE